MITKILRQEGLVISADIIDLYLEKRERRIASARDAAAQFFQKNQQSDQIRATLGTALGGIIGAKGKAVVLAADGQTTWGNQKFDMNTRKIHEIDQFTVVAGTGTVAFIQDIVRIFEADVGFIQDLKSNGTFISPNGKANLLASLVKSIIILPLYYGIGIGFLLGLYNPKDDEARLFQICPFGSIIEKDILSDGCGKDWVFSVLTEHYKELGARNINKRAMLKLVRRAINSASSNDVFCGGKKTLYLVDSNGIRRIL